MKVYYIYHSAFAVELDESILIFDYYKGDVSDIISNTNKHIYVFNSHSHGDHYSDEMFSWAISNRDITYILSDDIHVSVKTLGKYGLEGKNKPSIISVKPYEDRRIGEIRLRTLESTDMGVAFIVEAEGKQIYHAGDLHFWAWMNKGEAYVSHEGEIYKEQLEKIKGEHMDVAFVVLDPRLESGYAKGMETFLEMVDADVIFPMHQWGDYELTNKFKSSNDSINKDKIVSITKEGQEFEI